MKQNVRALAAQILTEVIGQKKSLPQVVSEHIPEDYAQRPLLFELCYGSLRWYASVAEYEYSTICNCF